MGALLFFYVYENRSIGIIFEIDAKNTEEVFDRVNNIIGDSLKTFVYDYTYWDEMVAFVRNGNIDWAKFNIETSVPTYKTNAVWIYKLDKNLTYKFQNLDDSFYDVLPLPKIEISKVFEKSAFCHFFVNTPKGVMEIRGATIHPSEDKERKTPAAGYFFAGRLWDEPFLKNISQATDTNVTVSTGLTTSPARMNFKIGALVFYRVLPGWNGVTASLLKVETRSKIVPAFNDFSRTMLFMLVGFSIITFLIIIVSLIIWVIRPLGIILRSLSKEEPEHLRALSHKQDDLGRIARLIQNFFEQNSLLISEIDIRKQTEEALRKEKELSESIIDTAQVILLLLDTKGRIVKFNPYMEQVLGYRLEEVAGKDWFETFLPKDIREETRVVFANGLRGIQTKGHINPVMSKDGHEFQIEWYDKTIKGADGNVEKLLAIGIDVSERKKVERSMRLAQLGKLISDISHEINNPLMIISGNAQISLAPTTEEDEIKNSLKVIFEESQRAKAIISRVLKFARPSKGMVKAVDINHSIEGVASIVEHQFKLANIQIKRNYAEDLPLVEIDEQQLNEVFMNLMINAKEAMSKGGVITISTSLEKKFVRIDFKDTGSGMSEEVKQKLFEPFFTTKKTGTGLGLSICHGIINTYNGLLEFESQSNMGTTASVMLPWHGEAA